MNMDRNRTKKRHEDDYGQDCDDSNDQRNAARNKRRENDERRERERRIDRYYDEEDFNDRSVSPVRPNVYSTKSAAAEKEAKLKKEKSNTSQHKQ